MVRHCAMLVLRYTNDVGYNSVDGRSNKENEGVRTLLGWMFRRLHKIYIT
jgi:hypothetical protein